MTGVGGRLPHLLSTLQAPSGQSVVEDISLWSFPEEEGGPVVVGVGM